MPTTTTTTVAAALVPLPRRLVVFCVVFAAAAADVNAILLLFLLLPVYPREVSSFPSSVYQFTLANEAGISDEVRVSFCGGRGRNCGRLGAKGLQLQQRRLFR
jgi:hypothetical protein